MVNNIYPLKMLPMRRPLAAHVAVLFFMMILASSVSAQIAEPEVRGTPDARSPLDENLNNGISLNVLLNNFGVGIGGEYKRMLSREMEGTLTLRITGLRDVSEQTFTDFWFGQQVVPNKYRRAFSIPMMVGVRHRLFADQVADNYRFYISGDLGPVLAFSYPYFDDVNEDGYRFNFPEIGLVEPVNDVFTGLGDGSWHLGLAGEVRLSLDIGENFSRLTSVQLGFMGYYFNQGIQMMQPYEPVLSQDPESNFPFEHTDPDDPVGSIVMKPFFDAQKFFGTPQISFIFGRMW